jgi:hypothetical protein
MPPLRSGRQAPAGSAARFFNTNFSNIPRIVLKLRKDCVGERIALPQSKKSRYKYVIDMKTEYFVPECEV